MRLYRLAYLVVTALLLATPVSAFAAKPVGTANPVVTSTSSWGQEPGTNVVINGTGFGPRKESNFPTFGGVRGGVVTWTDTQIVARVPQNASPGYLGVIVDGVVSNGFYFVPGVPPQVTSVSSQGAEAGARVTITGLDFGTAQDIGWATVAGVSANVVSWSDTQVVLESPSSAPPGWIGIWQNGICSNGKWFVTGGLPEITAVSTDIARPGDRVTVTGKHFGTEPEGAYALTWGDLEISPDSWSDGSITFTVPVGAASGYLGITRDGVVSNGWQLPFGPRLTALSDWWGAPGTTLTLTGVGFGDTAGRVTFGGVDGQVVSWSPSRVVATIPNGAPEGDVGVWRDGIASNGLWFLPSAAPNIAAITPVAASPGETVTVTGTSFGSAETSESMLTMGGRRIPATTWSDTSITFSMPASSAAEMVGVSRKGLTSNGVMLFPVGRITGLSEWWGGPGTQITITGIGFGDSPDRVTFGGVDAQVLSWSPTSIVAVVPSAAAEGDVGVWRGAFASNGVRFVPIDRPVIDTVSPTVAGAGDTVTVDGSGFGDTADVLTVGGVSVTPASWTDTRVTFVVPEGLATGYVGVTRRGITSNGVFLQVGPRVTALSSWWGEPGSTLSIDGVGFGDTPGTVSIGGVSAPVTSWTRTQVRVTVPADAPEGEVVVSQGGNSSQGVWFLPMYAPAIRGLDVSSAAIGATVTIDGAQFGDTQGESAIRLGGVDLQVVSWSDTRITAVIPGGAASGYVGVWKRGVASNGSWLSITP